MLPVLGGVVLVGILFGAATLLINAVFENNRTND
jgi:hypothetical protein